jgi:mono/diheme cytochrome c family protein
MRIRTVVLHGALGVALIGAARMTVGAQAPIEKTQPILAESLAGRDSFELYCAPCHGSGGRGDGPVVAALKTRPADLTTVARRHDGRYPREAVRAIIEGTSSAVPAHGSTQMPVWGPLFRAFESDARVRARIANLVTHIESLQAPTTLPQDAGSQLFRTHCAPCHGTAGRGDGPMAVQMRRTPPDLTRFTGRNGGMFPSERVRRIIDGRDVPSHGDREMPVWGDVFRIPRGEPATPAAVARLDAILRYLEAIQKRGAE